MSMLSGTGTWAVLREASPPSVTQVGNVKMPSFHRYYQYHRSIYTDSTGQDTASAEL